MTWVDGMFVNYHVLKLQPNNMPNNVHTHTSFSLNVTCLLVALLIINLHYDTSLSKLLYSIAEAVMFGN